MKPRSLCAMLIAAALWVSLAPKLALAAPEKETWLGLPVESASQEYALKGGVAVELSKVKVQTTVPIEIGKVWITPDWADWITEFRTSRVRATTGDIVARPSSLARLGVIDGPSSRIVTKISFSGLKLVFGTSELVLPAGEMRFKPDGTLSIIRAVFENGMSVELTPQASGKLSVLVQSGNTKWAVLPAFIFDNVVAQGEMSDDTVTLDKIGASGQEGALSGSLKLVSAGKFMLEGDLKMESIHVDAVISRLYRRSTVTGFLNGDFKLAASGDTLDSLAQSTVVNGSYVLKSGGIDKFGLLEGMRRNGSGVVGGGLVRFESINGKFKGGAGLPAQADFQGLASGALRGSSNVTIMPDGKLKGTAFGSLALPGGENLSRSFDISGTVDAPSLSSR